MGGAIVGSTDVTTITYNTFDTNSSGVRLAKSSGNLIAQFDLAQNYPNPFNPSTNIRYCIPFLGGDEKGGLITLKVYDILGNEIATLINENKPAGEYEVEFNASRLSSGIYLYRITANSFNRTRKMILMK